MHDAPGGDTVQILNTAEALRGRGCYVSLTSTLDCDLSKFDLAHLWHLERLHESYPFLKRARTSQLPVALSPIYYPFDGRPRPHSQRRDAQDLKNILRFFKAPTIESRRGIGEVVRRGWARCRAEMLESVDVLLPNSTAEAEIIRAECRRPCRLVVVPNVVGPDVERTCHTPPPSERREVVSVGHFDPRKNQLLLIKALRETGISVTFIGGPRPMHERYFRQCVRQAGGRHRFVGPLPRPEVLRLFQRARLQICSSLLETPGLANLEAVALGCQVVLPDCPPVREYFGPSAHYFHVQDAASLRGAVLRAMETQHSNELQRLVCERFTFKALADKTLRAYDMIRAQRSSGASSKPARACA